MAFLVNPPPCVLHEDDHILVIHKPAGLNTHSPSPYAGEGIYEWLKNREPRWSTLAIVHRLDKGTSGVMVFAKSPPANRSLTEQFATRKVRKTYRFLTEHPPRQAQFAVKSAIVRAGDKYFSRPQGDRSEMAETEFNLVGRSGRFFEIQAVPLTGRTHQIRVHAQSQELPIAGDDLYGGAPFPRLCLHACRLEFFHPATSERLVFEAEPAFEADPSIELRRLLIDPGATDACRLINGAADRWPGFYVERWNGFLLAQSAAELTSAQMECLRTLQEQTGARGAYHKILDPHVRKAKAAEASPSLVLGEAAPEYFVIKENHVSYEASFERGYSSGLFLDQRDNRRRLLANHAGAGFELSAAGLAGRNVLNTFAYTCGFSLCAALAGARTTSIDLSRNYLDWGRRNFGLNRLDMTGHDFIFGDVFEWARRLGKKERLFDLILLDPPTFSQAKPGGIFQAEKHFGRLVSAVLPLLACGGVLFCSTNAQKIAPEMFLDQIQQVMSHARRKITQTHYVPQPVDFPISREEPAYLKTVWLRVE